MMEFLSSIYTNARVKFQRYSVF